jgi:hypothetical protein
MRQKIIIGVIGLVLLACLIGAIVLMHSGVGFPHE